MTHPSDMSLRQVPRVRGVSREFRQESRRIIQDIFRERPNSRGDDYRISLISNASAIGNVEKRDSSAIYADEADRSSIHSIQDWFEGGTGSGEAEEFNQNGQDDRQTRREEIVVGWDGPNDPQNPQNWKRSKKYTMTVFYASLTFCVTFSSSVFSPATAVTAKLFGVSNEVMTLGTSLFVLVSLHARFHPIIHSTLTQEIGVCSRPNHVGSPLRTLRPEASPILCILPLRHLPNPRRCRPKYRNDHALSILCRTVWMFTTNDSWRNIV